MPPMCAITSSSAWSGIKMCLAQQNSDGEESHDGLTDEKSTQIAADAVDGEGKQAQRGCGCRRQSDSARK